MLRSKKLFERRKKRVRYAISRFIGDKCRLSVFRSNANIYAQIISDKEGKTLVCASTLDKDLRASLKGSASNVEAAASVGRLLAERAKKAGIVDVVFDRGGYKYHGRVKALADSAREAGLKF